MVPIPFLDVDVLLMTRHLGFRDDLKASGAQEAARRAENQAEHTSGRDRDFVSWRVSGQSDVNKLSLKYNMKLTPNDAAARRPGYPIALLLAP